MPGGITCASCGKRYRARPELAGKKVRCKCGATIAVPAGSPADSPDPYALDDGPETSGPAASAGAAAAQAAGRCPSCEKPVSAGAAICVGCGYNFETGQALTTATGGRAVKQAGAGPRRAGILDFRTRRECAGLPAPPHRALRASVPPFGRLRRGPIPCARNEPTRIAHYPRPP